MKTKGFNMADGLDVVNTLDGPTFVSALKRGGETRSYIAGNLGDGFAVVQLLGSGAAVTWGVMSRDQLTLMDDFAMPISKPLLHAACLSDEDIKPIYDETAALCRRIHHSGDVKALPSEWTLDKKITEHISRYIGDSGNAILDICAWKHWIYQHLIHKYDGEFSILGNAYDGFVCWSEDFAMRHIMTNSALLDRESIQLLSVFREPISALVPDPERPKRLLYKLICSEGEDAVDDEDEDDEDEDTLDLL